MFKDSQGRWLTKALFFEMSSPDMRDKYPPKYTLKDYEHEGLPSAKEIYLASLDPTEYQAAQDLLGSWKHWTVLCESDWFKPYLEEWRIELEVAIRSKAVSLMRAHSAGSSAAAANAAKWIAEGKWKDKKDTKGEDANKKEAKVLRLVTSAVDEDLNRMNNFDS